MKSIVPAKYDLKVPLTEQDVKKVQGLLRDANFTYPRVFFDEKGDVLTALNDPSVRSLLVFVQRVLVFTFYLGLTS